MHMISISHMPRLPPPAVAPPAPAATQLLKRYFPIFFGDGDGQL